MISVVVVTHNRREMVRRCIRGLLEQDHKGGREIIVVDDGSRDKTAAFLKEAFPDGIRLIENPHEAGLSVSKNMGIEISRGDIVAFTDDDCMVSPSWMSRIEDALKNADMTAGPVLAAEGTRWPFWWRRSMDWAVGLSLAGTRFMPLGSNMAFRREALEKIGGFSTSINRTRDFLFFGEDTEIFQRALRKGFRFFRDDRLFVYHDVPPERLTVPRLLWRSYMEGRSLAYRERGAAAYVKRCLAVAVNPARFLFSWDANHLLRMIVSMGYLSEYRHRRACAG